MVVLRSTTPCVAVNSRSNSTLLTVISIVPTAVPAAMTASTGIDFALPCRLLLLLLPYIKCKTYKTSSNSRWVGEVENFGKRPIDTTLEIALSVRNRSRTCRSLTTRFPLLPTLPTLAQLPHLFHRYHEGRIHRSV